MRTPLAEIELVGPGGEPVDLQRTISSHGLVELPPLRVGGGTLEITLPMWSLDQIRLLRIQQH